jgi:hypothetical protein
MSIRHSLAESVDVREKFKIGDECGGIILGRDGLGSDATGPGSAGCPRISDRLGS